jgi:hypothetical protein
VSRGFALYICFKKNEKNLLQFCHGLVICAAIDGRKMKKYNKKLQSCVVGVVTFHVYGCGPEKT